MRGGALRIAAVAGLAVAAMLAVPELALATTDTTFGDPLDTVEGIVGGTGGQLAAALAVGAALVGSVLRFNAMQLMGAVGVGIAAGTGTGIVTGMRRNRSVDQIAATARFAILLEDRPGLSSLRPGRWHTRQATYTGSRTLPVSPWPLALDLTRDRSGRGASPCPRRRQSRPRTAARSPPTHTLRQAPGAGSSSRR